MCLTTTTAIRTDKTDSKVVDNSTVTEKAGPRTDFYTSDVGEPHKIRRKEILAKYPQIEELFGNDPSVVPYVLLTIGLQLTLSYYQKDWSVGFFLLIAWSIGGAASHALSLMTHEVSHNLVFESPAMNEYFGILCNVGMGVPSSTMFKRYHMEHHLWQGDDLKDTDIPTMWEGRFFTNTLLKCVWLFCQPLFYALRPGIVSPKKLQRPDIMNIAVIIITDCIIAYFWGLRAVLYLALSTVLGMGFHPVAGHFIAEHYVFTEGHETYSYYGALNYICWNVGYHNEHHDFPRVPGWRLPMVKKIAPEYYENLPSYSSWTMVLFNYITDPNMGPFYRVRRNRKYE